jgi:mRNA interferase YafQ
MLNIRYTNQLKKDLKRVKKQNQDLALFEEVVTRLQKQQPLARQHKDHPLRYNWRGYRECHLNPDWLLIYAIEEDSQELWLVRTGSHAELFE